MACDAEFCQSLEKNSVKITRTLKLLKRSVIKHHHWNGKKCLLRNPQGPLSFRDYHYTNRIKKDLDLLLHRNVLEDDENINL